MIEPEDLLGEDCRRMQQIIRNSYKILEDKAKDREMMFRYNLEKMIKHDSH